jgi:hypothetical protein
MGDMIETDSSSAVGRPTQVEYEPSERIPSGALLTVGAMLAFFGAALFGLGGRDSANSLFFLTRSFILAAVVTNALGLALLESLLRDAGERVFSRLGLIGFLIGAALAVVAEALLLDGSGDAIYTLNRVYVVLAFLSQAAYGGALLRTALLPTWVGRMTIAWNLGAFAVLLAVNVGTGPDYYPILHHIAPLLIGIELIRHRPGAGQHPLNS